MPCPGSLGCRAFCRFLRLPGGCRPPSLPCCSPGGSRPPPASRESASGTCRWRFPGARGGGLWPPRGASGGPGGLRPPRWCSEWLEVRLSPRAWLP
eukprot:3513117-Alexandrium_andersonii.AAC.1